MTRKLDPPSKHADQKVGRNESSRLRHEADATPPPEPRDGLLFSPRDGLSSDAVGEPASFQSVAKTFSNLATNVLVTGVIFIVGLAFGREIISWWRSDSTPGEIAPITTGIREAVPAANADLQLLEFGDFPFVLKRQEFVGDVAEVLEQLRIACRAAVASSQPLAQEFGPAEQRMLDAAGRLDPVEQRADRWSIYQTDTPLPIVIGVRLFDSQVAGSDRRVVSWGLAVPDATFADKPQSEWTLFTYSSGSKAETTHEKHFWPAPPGGQRTLSLRSERGGSIVGYAGVGTVESWTNFYHDLFSASPSQPAGDWQVEFGTWRRQYTIAGAETIQIVIRYDGGEMLHSLVLSSPSDQRRRDN